MPGKNQVEIRDLPAFERYMEAQGGKRIVAQMRAVYEDLEKGIDRSTEKSGWETMRERIQFLRTWKGDPPVIVSSNGKQLFDGRRRVAWAVVRGIPCPAVYGERPEGG